MGTETREPDYSYLDEDILSMAIEAVDLLRERTGKRFTAQQRDKLTILIYRYLVIEQELAQEAGEAEGS